MRRIGHHIYTSFGGYRTVYCSEWLQDRSKQLEARAQACYVDIGGFDCRMTGDEWTATFVIDNGVDHVGRPRGLVQQVVFSANDSPPVFSPLLLRAVCLENLQYEDPQLGKRLIEDFDALDLATLMPRPSVFAELIAGPVRPILEQGFRALVEPEEAVILTGFEHRDRVMADLPAALCVLLLHDAAWHLSSLSQPLGLTGSDTHPRLFLPGGRGYRQGKTSSIRRAPETFEPGKLVLDLIAANPKPHLVLFLLRRLAPKQLFQVVPLQRLIQLQAAGQMTLDREGELELAKDASHALDVLTVIQALGGQLIVNHVLTRWTEHLSVDPEDLQELDARILAATNPDALALAIKAIRTLQPQ